MNPVAFLSILMAFLAGCGLQDPLLYRALGPAPALAIGNYGNRAVVNSGFLGGTSTGAASVRVSFDGGSWKLATGTDTWKVKLPCMQDDGMRWSPGTIHSVRVQILSSAGTVIAEKTLTLQTGRNLDINGDGYTDLAVGASGVSSDTGKVYLYLSSASGISAVNATDANAMLTGASNNDIFGTSIALGDVNGDGYADLLVGASGFNGGGATGRVYIFHSQGSSGVGSQTFAGANTVLTGGAVNDYFGNAIAVRDVNDDGFEDAIVGAQGYNNGTNQGRVYVFQSQGAAGIATAGVAGATSVLTGGLAGNRFGYYVSAGDINGDSYADVLVGAYVASASRGQVYAFHSSGAGGIPSVGAGAANTTLTGNSPSDRLGPVASCDVNNDGYDDIIAGAYGYNGGTNQGQAYVFHSQGAGGVASQSAATASSILTGAAAGDRFGYSVAGGDTNADGFCDVIAGAHSRNLGQGSAYVFHSTASGIPSASAAVATTTLSGVIASGQFGICVASGDLNGDGYIDVAIGAANITLGNGIVYTFQSRGGAGLSSTMTNQITGESLFDVFGQAVGLR